MRRRLYVPSARGPQDGSTFRINEEGGVNPEEAKAARQEAVRARLAAKLKEDNAMEVDGSGEEGPDHGHLGGPMGSKATDYMSKEEAERLLSKKARAGSLAGCVSQPPVLSPACLPSVCCLQGKKEKEKRKLRRREKVDLGELEAQAAEAGSDLGSRAQREARAARLMEEEMQRKRDKEAAFNRALEKANYASLALRNEAEAEEATICEEDEEDEARKRLSCCLARSECTLLTICSCAGRVVQLDQPSSPGGRGQQGGPGGRRVRQAAGPEAAAGGAGGSGG